MPTSEVLVGFLGVIIGTIATATLTIYKERFTAKREREAREAQRTRERQDQRNTFQRESILALQQAVSDIVKSVYDEQDRLLIDMADTNRWPARTWETVTAAGWSDAERRLEMLNARVFDEELRRLAASIRLKSRDSVWAPTMDDAKKSNVALKDLVQRFHDRVRGILPTLYAD